MKYHLKRIAVSLFRLLATIIAAPFEIAADALASLRFHPWQDWPRHLAGYFSGAITALFVFLILDPLAWAFGPPFIQMRRWFKDMV